MNFSLSFFLFPGPLTFSIEDLGKGLHTETGWVRRTVVNTAEGIKRSSHRSTEQSKRSHDKNSMEVLLPFKRHNQQDFLQIISPHHPAEKCIKGEKIPGSRCSVATRSVCARKKIFSKVIKLKIETLKFTRRLNAEQKANSTEAACLR
jgi:hypothetical protein